MKKKTKATSVGDDDLDNEGEVMDRTPRQIKENQPVRGPPPPVLSQTGAPLDPTQTVVGRYVKPKRHKKHYMQSKTWVKVAQQSKPLHAIDEGRNEITNCLHLEHVHGFSGQQARNNVLYTNTGTIVYIAAALGICVDASNRSSSKQPEQQQRYMSAHTDDILSIAIWNPPPARKKKPVKKKGGKKGGKKEGKKSHSKSGNSNTGTTGSTSNTMTGNTGNNNNNNSNKGHTNPVASKMSVVATGESGKSPKIIMWDPATMEVLNIIEGAHERGVVQLAFSPDGNTLASIGLDNQNSLTLHHWKEQGNTGLLTKMRTGGDKVFGLSFHTNTVLVSCGHRHMTFWKKSGGNGDENGWESSAARFGKELAGETSECRQWRFF